MAVRPWHLLSLCDGYGGTELALRSVARVRTVARVERDAYAAAVLVERMGEARLDQCPVWDDVATFDGRAWRGRVDIVAAGFPCPDFSSAGLRAGVDGEHWLWPECFEVIRQVGPSIVLLENVPGLVRLGGLTRVLSDLADDGFDAEWGLLAAAAVGAPHERERWWLVAWSDVADASRQGNGTHAGKRVLQSRTNGEAMADCACSRRGERSDGALVGGLPTDIEASRNHDVGHAGSTRRSEVTGGAPGDEATARADAQGDHVADCADEGLGHAASGRCVQGQRPAARNGRADRVEAAVGFPPGPDDHDGWADWIAAGGPQPVLRRLADGPPVGLADALHLGGNGLVPQCAAHAWGQLLERGGWLT